MGKFFNMFLRITLFLFLFCQFNIWSQEIDLAVTAIPNALTENANAVIRLDQTDVTISSRKAMNTIRKRIVTVYNEAGIKYIDASEYFDNTTRIKSIEAVIYNSQGSQLKKIKKKDFKEQSVSRGSIITDNRILYLDYTPIQYPFTIVFTSEKQSATTAFLPRWFPLEGPHVSTEKSGIVFNYADDLGFKYKLYNFEGTDFKETIGVNSVTLTSENMTAIKSEAYSPSYQSIIPHAIFGLEKFNLEGVDGEATDWVNFGSWMYNNLLEGTDELSEETVEKINDMVGDEKDPIAKAKIVYEYVQSKTRYISIQLGIGGWKPMLAKDVDRLGYGDCKALTNYTRALLKAVDVTSYYTVIYGDTDKRNILEDFVSMQGNHVILAVPDKDNNIVWLECTNQYLPFGSQGSFTDDRLALLVKPNGGEIVNTHEYDVKENTQTSKGNYSINVGGGIIGEVVIISKGIQYHNKYSIESKSADALDKFYKSSFSNINNLKINKTGLENNKEIKEFKEYINIEAQSYCIKSGDKLMFVINAFNQSSLIPQRYRDRKLPFEISRGYYDTDEIIITLPEGFSIEAKPNDVTLKDTFGEYKVEYIIEKPDKLLYKRSLLIDKGLYSSDEYEKYRDFREKISRYDNAKVILFKH